MGLEREQEPPARKGFCWHSGPGKGRGGGGESEGDALFQLGGRRSENSTEGGRNTHAINQNTHTSAFERQTAVYTGIFKGRCVRQTHNGYIKPEGNTCINFGKCSSRVIHPEFA